MVQLQSILLPDATVCDVEELYYYRTENRTDFDGYFNLFYIEKRKRYTCIENLSLDLQLQGYSALILVHDGKDIDTIPLNSKMRKEYHIPFPYEKYGDGCFWFALIREESATIEPFVSGFYTTVLPEGQVRDVRIGTVICTYKREAYVTWNLKQIKTRIFDRTELDVSSRIKLYVVDNGKTLNDCEEVQELVASYAGKAVILPNRNAGGAGGFTRGMIEIMETESQKVFTHLLLMDDDAVAETDAFVRIYGLTATLKEEWKDITIGGTMLREEMPYVLHCAGELWKSGRIIAPEGDLDLRNCANACSRYLLGTEMEREIYSGWWLCCYSMGTVRADNLPLPLFFHHDDIEYGLRNREKGIVFLNGISVWHIGADLRFRGSSLYYDIRNSLIETALHQEKRQTLTALKIVLLASAAAMVRLKYCDLNLIYQGFTDFLKGPEWLLAQAPEELNKKVLSMYYRMKPLGELRDELTEEEYQDVRGQIEQREDGLKEPQSYVRYEKGIRRKKTHVYGYGLTLIGLLLPGDRRIRVIMPTDSLNDAFRRKRILLYEPTSGLALVTEKNCRKLLEGILRCIMMTAECISFRKVAETYRKEADRMSDLKTWKEYLGI